MCKNYLIITTTGKAAYSTQVKGYKIVNNKPVLIGELHGQAQDNCLRYLNDIIKNSGSKIDVVKPYRNNEINIHEINL